jgi:hypothetical protein
MEKNIKLPSKVMTFDDVQKSLQTLESKVNELISSVNKDINTEFNETDGKPGDIRVFPNADQTYSLEACTDEGWKKLFASNYTNEEGKTEVYLDNKTKNTSPKRVGEYFDSRYLPTAPDYDSGWFTASASQIYTTGGENGVVPNSSEIYSDSEDAAMCVGIPGLGFNLNSMPHRISVCLGHANITSWSDVDGTSDSWVIEMTGGHDRSVIEETENHTWSGIQIYVSSATHVSVFTSGDYLMFIENSSEDEWPGPNRAITSAKMNVRIWK